MTDQTQATPLDAAILAVFVSWLVAVGELRDTLSTPHLDLVKSGGGPADGPAFADWLDGLQGELEEVSNTSAELARMVLGEVDGPPLSALDAATRGYAMALAMVKRHGYDIASKLAPEVAGDLALRRREEPLEASSRALEEWADEARARDEGMIVDAATVVFDFVVREVEAIANASLRTHGGRTAIEATTFGSMIARWKASQRAQIGAGWVGAIRPAAAAGEGAAS